MRLFQERCDLICFGIELDLGGHLTSGVRYVALRFGHSIIGIEWGQR